MRDNKVIILVTAFFIGIILVCVLISKFLYNSGLSNMKTDRRRIQELEQSIENEEV